MRNRNNARSIFTLIVTSLNSFQPRQKSITETCQKYSHYIVDKNLFFKTSFMSKLKGYRRLFMLPHLQPINTKVVTTYNN